MTRVQRCLVVVCGVALGCATSRPPESKAARPDTVPEKAAAQRAASGNLQLETEDERWGFDAARQRREESQKKPATTVVPHPDKNGGVPNTIPMTPPPGQPPPQP